MFGYRRVENSIIQVSNKLSYTRIVYYRCKFIDHLPFFKTCEFHDCDMSDCKFSDLIGCKLFNTKLNGCDFTEADVSYSITSAGSYCEAYKCKWIGVRAIMDCGFFGGLKCEYEDIMYFIMMAAIPESEYKTKIIQLLTPTARRKFNLIKHLDFRKQ